ncbi:MAG: glycosyltransferase [Planctomycetes bacterium]|nr:glycosyltransferase [Planctomycetota bacterium]
MRIALLSYEYPPETGFGGIGTYTYYHARALARLGHEVHVFAGSTRAERRTYDDAGVAVTRFRKVGPVERLLPRLERHELWWFQNRLQTAASAYAAVRREMSSGRFDVFEMPECGADGALLMQLHDLPGVVRLHSPAELIMPTYPSRTLDRALTAMVERIAMNGARALSSCSGWLAREVRQRLGVGRPIEVIPNGIELGIFDGDEGIDTVRLGVPKEGIRIFFANRIETRKGIEVVQELAAQVLPLHPSATLVLAGRDDGGYLERVFWPRMRELGLQERVRHLGGLKPNQVRACLKQTDVFLLPSIWENAPYSLLEAMSAGRAIVASDCGGIPEMLRHEVDGLVARTGDVASFRRCLERLLVTEGLRQRLGRSARQRIESRYTSERVALQSLDFYAWSLRAPVAFLAPGARLPELEVDAHNWFQAWWLRGSRVTERPVLARHDAGRPRLLGLPLAALEFVERVLARSYWDGAGTPDTRESAFLDELGLLLREAAARAHAAGSEPEASETLALPALTHPLFDDDVRATVLVDELWRLEAGPELRSWLARETAVAGFDERASRRPLLRELAALAARVAPTSASYELLRRIYRSVSLHARVVKQDKEWFAAAPRGLRLQEHVEALNLHAPLKRPAYPVAARPVAPVAGRTPAVTVLIPSFRHEAYVAAAIESVLGQEHVNLRVVVIDDASPDGTLAVARAIQDSRLEVHANPTNLGLGESLRRALANVETEWVAVLNSDDLFHRDRLRSLLAAAERHPDAAVIASDVATIDGRGWRIDSRTCCVVDHGQRVRDWLDWYERVRREAAEGGRQAAFDSLLRHNHLATSSNIFCRTDWLRPRIDACRDLAYCVDWMVFLLAAAEGRLAHVPEDLVGYRLHEANTVWFEAHGREGYVLEVNLVVARALRSWLAALDPGLAPLARARLLAELLGRHVAAHGETDGLLLYLFASASEVPGVALGEQPAGREAAAAAVRRKELERELAQQPLPAWRIAERVRDAERGRIARRLAEALLARSHFLEPETLRLRAALTQAGEGQADARAWQERFAEVQALTTELTAELTASRSEAERQLRTELAAAADLAQARLAEALRQAAEREQSLRQDAEAQLARVQSALEQERRTWGKLESELRDWASRLELQRRRELAGVRATIDWKVGRMVLDTLHLRGPAKATQRLWRRMRLGWARRWLRRAGPQGGGPRIAVVAPDLPGEEGGIGLLADAQVLLAAGLDVLVAGWVGGQPRFLGASAASLARRQHWIAPDAAQLAADMAWWRGACPERVAQLAAEYQDEDWLGRICCLARSLERWRPTLLLASGSGRTARTVAAAAHLLDLPFVLSLGRQDAVALPSRGSREGERLLRASALLVDSDATGREAARGFGSATPCIVRLPVLQVGRVSSAAANRICLVAFGPVEDHPAWQQALRGLAELRGRGLEAELHVVLAELETPAGLAAADRVRWWAHAAGLAEHVHWHAGAHVDGYERVVSAGHVAVIPAAAEQRETVSWPRALGFAAGAGLPIVLLGDGAPAASANPMGARVVVGSPHEFAEAVLAAARGQGVRPTAPESLLAWPARLRECIASHSRSPEGRSGP